MMEGRIHLIHALSEVEFQPGPDYIADSKKKGSFLLFSVWDRNSAGIQLGLLLSIRSLPERRMTTHSGPDPLPLRSSDSEQQCGCSVQLSSGIFSLTAFSRRRENTVTVLGL